MTIANHAPARVTRGRRTDDGDGKAASTDVDTAPMRTILAIEYGNPSGW